MKNKQLIETVEADDGLRARQRYLNKIVRISINLNLEQSQKARKKYGAETEKETTAAINRRVKQLFLDDLEIANEKI